MTLKLHCYQHNEPSGLVEYVYQTNAQYPQLVNTTALILNCIYDHSPYMYFNMLYNSNSFSYLTFPFKYT